VAEHDNGYKLLFSHAEMVADLLRGFVHEPWVAQLDFGSLEKVNASYVTGHLRSREGDVVWRLRLGGDRWLYVYILVEFQSTVDPFMAVRMLVYVGLLYQDLIHQGAFTAEGKLPPVFPFLLYNGRGPWGSPVEVADLIAEVPGGLSRYQPRLSYFLLDEGRVGEQDLAGQNLMAALVRLERSRGPGEVQEVLASLLAWLEGPERAALRRSFATWIRAVLLPARMPQAEIPEVQDLQEVRSMLAERVVEWTEEWKREGFEEGFEDGFEEGVGKSLAAAREVLVQHLEERFGALPPVALAKLEAIDSVAALLELGFAAPGAASLADLGLE
jgi:predicted transposase/invertase (TIGR01784 family)